MIYMGAKLFERVKKAPVKKKTKRNPNGICSRKTALQTIDLLSDSSDSSTDFNPHIPFTQLRVCTVKFHWNPSAGSETWRKRGRIRLFGWLSWLSGINGVHLCTFPAIFSTDCPHTHLHISEKSKC